MKCCIEELSVVIMKGQSVPSFSIVLDGENNSKLFSRWNAFR